MRLLSAKWALLPGLFLITNCGSAGTGSAPLSVADGTKPVSAPQLSLSLVDAPNQALTKVNVKIKFVELWLEKGTIQKRIMVAQGLGDVDLLTLQNGITLPIITTEIPPQVHVRKIRLILEDSGHYANKLDGSTCELKTPSAQKTGIKLQMPENVVMENGKTYSLVVDFDAAKSVVQKGNGGCNLKPVLKLKSAHCASSGGESTQPPVDLTGGTTLDNSSDNTSTTTPASGDGFDGADPSTGGDLIPISDLPIYF